MKSILSMMVFLGACVASANTFTCYDTVGADLVFRLQETTAEVTATHVGLDKAICTKYPMVPTDSGDVSFEGQCHGLYKTQYLLNTTTKLGYYLVQDDKGNTINNGSFFCQVSP